jgi:predicted MPP superfamily phosphohydrolase
MFHGLSILLSDSVIPFFLTVWLTIPSLLTVYQFLSVRLENLNWKLSKKVVILQISDMHALAIQCT